MNQTEITQLEAYLKKRFANQDMGIVYRDDEDGDICYHVQLTVLAEDLG